MKFVAMFGTAALCATLVAAFRASAGVSITAPTSKDVWTAGTMGKSVTFTYDRGCSGGSADLTHGLLPDWFNNFGAQAGSPVTIPVGTVPTNGAAGTKNPEKCEVQITQGDGTQATDAVNMNIQN
jgi:hypothetical protein